MMQAVRYGFIQIGLDSQPGLVLSAVNSFQLKIQFLNF